MQLKGFRPSAAAKKLGIIIIYIADMWKKRLLPVKP
jgi:hypothetical protein